MAELTADAASSKRSLARRSRRSAVCSSAPSRRAAVSARVCSSVITKARTLITRPLPRTQKGTSRSAREWKAGSVESWSVQVWPPKMTGTVRLSSRGVSAEPGSRS